MNMDIITTAKPILAEYISTNLDICGGKPCILGTRIRVQDIYSFHEGLGMSVDKIIETWPYLNHAQVHAALAYAWEHRDEILALLKRAEDLNEQLQAQQPSLLEKTLVRLRERSANCIHAQCAFSKEEQQN